VKQRARSFNLRTQFDIMRLTFDNNGSRSLEHASLRLCTIPVITKTVADISIAQGIQYLAVKMNFHNEQTEQKVDKRWSIPTIVDFFAPPRNRRKYLC